MIAAATDVGRRYAEGDETRLAAFFVGFAASEYEAAEIACVCRLDSYTGENSTRQRAPKQLEYFPSWHGARQNASYIIR